MLSFLFEHRYRVLLSRFSGGVGDEDLLSQVRLAKAIGARRTVSGAIMDFTDVASFDVSPGVVSSLARLANRKSRVFVVPTPEMFGLARLYATINGLSSVRPPMLVKTREEAYRCLDLVSPTFEPLEVEP